MLSVNQDQPSSLSPHDTIKQIIANVSKNSNFQIKIIVFFMFISFLTTFMGFSNNFYYMNPVFHCEGYEQKVTEEEACFILDICHLINKQTITAQLNLYCDSKKQSRILLQTSMGFGNWGGIVFAGLISDRKGRKFTFNIGLFLLNLASLLQYIGISGQHVSLLFISNLIEGFSFTAIYLNFLVLLTRFVNKQAYELGTIGWLLISYGINQIALSIVIKYFDSWKALFYVYAIGILLFSFLSCLVLKEDPIYLYQQGQQQQFIDVVSQIARQNEVQSQQINKSIAKSIELFQLKISNHGSNSVDQTTKFDICEIFRWDLVITMLIIGVVGCFYQMTGKSIDLTIQSLKYSYDFNLLLVGASNVLGYSSAIYLMKLEPNKKIGFLFSSIIYGILAMFFLFPFCYQSGAVQSVIIVLLRFFLCWISNFYTRLKVDSFPKKYQVTCISIIQFMANCGHVFGPMIVQMSVEKKMSPIITINILRVTVGTLPLLYLMQRQLGLEGKQQRLEIKQDNI